MNAPVPIKAPSVRNDIPEKEGLKLIKLRIIYE